jgi:hypothetical protein
VVPHIISAAASEDASTLPAFSIAPCTILAADAGDAIKFGVSVVGVGGLQNHFDDAQVALRPMLDLERTLGQFGIATDSRWKASR